MKKPILLIAFGLTAMLHLGIPYMQIHKQEAILNNGREILLRTRPVDPYDIFRGRYVALAFTQTQISNNYTFVRGSKAYAQYTQDEDGFITITGLTEKPESKDDLRVEINYSNASQTTFRYPFDRFYMNEKIAPEAERAYRELNRQGASNTWARVRVLNNQAVLDDLILDGTPANQYVIENPGL